MRNLILIILLYSSFLKAQTTLIPDPNFEQALINLGLDITLDGQILTTNIDTVTELYVDSLNISDLTGIEDFTNLKLLMCFYNQLSNLNLTQNDSLQYLYASSNQLTSINLSQNNTLFSLGVYNNLITSLDLSQNLNLTTLSCGMNPINSLNLSLQQQFRYLDCSISPSLQCLKINNGNNLNILYFNVTNSPNLTCVEVDNASYSTTNWTNIDSQTSFSTNCPNPCLVGIKETTNLKASFYPNPTTGIINIDLEETKANLKATLSNSLGQVVFTKNYKLVNYIKLNFEVPKGIYFLKLESEEEIQTLKVLKE